jgi:hypothetical protein
MAVACNLTCSFDTTRPGIDTYPMIYPLVVNHNTLLSNSSLKVQPVVAPIAVLKLVFSSLLSHEFAGCKICHQYELGLKVQNDICSRCHSSKSKLIRLCMKLPLNCPIYPYLKKLLIQRVSPLTCDSHKNGVLGSRENMASFFFKKYLLLLLCCLVYWLKFLLSKWFKTVWVKKALTGIFFC